MEESIVERVLILIKDYGLTASEFADKIDVQRSSMSHLVSGRNKPSLDFIQKILHNFSDINPTWLIMGSGPMKQLDLFDTKGDVAPAVPLPTKETTAEEPKPTTAEQPTVKHAFQAESIRAIAEPTPAQSQSPIVELQSIQQPLSTSNVATQAAQPVIQAVPTPITQPVQTASVVETTAPVLQTPPSQTPQVHSTAEKSATNDKKVVKIVFFYSDNTFESFNPQ
jgi:transcriptional regulator with XRE-family HTH domain